MLPTSKSRQTNTGADHAYGFGDEMTAALLRAFHNSLPLVQRQCRVDKTCVSIRKVILEHHVALWNIA